MLDKIDMTGFLKNVSFIREAGMRIKLNILELFFFRVRIERIM
jgi:hypothetical protein